MRLSRVSDGKDDFDVTYPSVYICQLCLSAHTYRFTNFHILCTTYTYSGKYRPKRGRDASQSTIEMSPPLHRLIPCRAERSKHQPLVTRISHQASADKSLPGLRDLFSPHRKLTPRKFDLHFFLHKSTVVLAGENKTSWLSKNWYSFVSGASVPWLRDIFFRRISPRRQRRPLVLLSYRPSGRTHSV